jgi:hypothetical protein
MTGVKIDEEFLKKIKKLIKEGENRFDFPSVKSFIDRAVLNLLKESEKKR